MWSSSERRLPGAISSLRPLTVDLLGVPSKLDLACAVLRLAGHLATATVALVLPAACSSNPKPDDPGRAASSVDRCDARREQVLRCGSRDDADLDELSCRAEAECFGHYFTPTYAAHVDECASRCDSKCVSSIPAHEPSAAWATVSEPCQRLCTDMDPATCTKPLAIFRDALLLREAAECSTSSTDCRALFTCYSIAATKLGADMASCMGVAMGTQCEKRRSMPGCEKLRSALEKARRTPQ